MEQTNTDPEELNDRELRKKKVRERYYQKNKTRIRERQKKYYDSHKELYAAYEVRKRNKYKDRIAAYMKEWNIRNRDKKREYNKQRRHLDKDTRLKHDYGMSLEQYNDLISKQNGECAICGNKTWRGKGPHVDHDHSTGAVRGILCFLCNSALGMINDDIGVSIKLTEYLIKHKGGTNGTTR